jgi:hypothetical protein
MFQEAHILKIFFCKEPNGEVNLRNRTSFYIGLVAVPSFLALMLYSLISISLGSTSIYHVFSCGVGFFGMTFSAPYFLLEKPVKAE